MPLSQSIRTLLSAKTMIGHLVVRTILLLLLFGILIYMILPLIFWAIFGEGASATRIAEKPISIFIYDFIPLLIGLGICIYKVIRKIRSNSMSEAKSYLIAGLILLVEYPFRIAIIDWLFNLFQS